MRKQLKTLLALFATVTGLLLSAQLAAKPLPSLLTLYLGESQVLEARGAERIAVGKAELVGSTLLESGQIVLTADKVGETNLQIWFRNGSRESVMIVIVESNGYRELREIKQLLGNIPGINIRAVGRRVVIEGDLMKRDLERVEIVKQRYNNMLVLAQEVNDFDQKMLYFQINVTEIVKSKAQELGINWSTSVNGPNLAYVDTFSRSSVLQPNYSSVSDNFATFDSVPAGYSGSSTFFGIGSEITSRINFLEETGAALSLASPRLSARSGGKADLLVGGQVPVVSSSVNGQTVEYKDFGISMEIEPQIDPRGSIIARVSTEVSDIQGGTAELPAFRTRRSQNDVRLRAGETLVISGLINRDQDYSYNKVKWLGDIPILGALFRSKSFDAGETELVIFITPEVVDNTEEGINKAELERLEAFTEKFEEKWGSGILD